MAPRSNSFLERVRTPATQQSARPRQSSMPVTTGSRSSCKGRRRWPMSFGRISSSRRPIMSSSRPAPAATSWVAISASANFSVAARSHACPVCSRRSPRIARRFTRASPPAPMISRQSTPARRSQRAHRSQTPCEPAKSWRLCGAPAAAPSPSLRLRSKGRSFELGRIGLYVEPTSAIAGAAFTKLIERGVVHPTETTVLVLTGAGLKTTRRIGELMGAL